MIYYKRKNFSKNGSTLGWSIVHYNHLSENRVWFVMYNRIQTISYTKTSKLLQFPTASLLTRTSHQIVPHATLNILTIHSEKGSEQLWSSIKNESTESVQHQLVAYYSMGHKVYPRLSCKNSHHLNTCDGQNSESICNCSGRHQAESI